MMQPQEDQLAATLAHQLKTPSSALQAAVTNLRRNLRRLLEELGPMSGGEAACGTTVEFIARCVAEPAHPPITGLLPKDRLDVILRRLGDAGIEGDLAAISACLLRGGWDTYLEEIVPLLQRDPSLILDALETTARLRSNLRTIEISLRRVSGITTALRLLSRPVDGPPVDLASRLESSAALVRETLPDGARLEMKLDPIPPVSGRQELLDEVWTNLLTNAAQAVGSGGLIRIEATTDRDDPGRAVVRVIDDGPGIPSQEAARIFEPFFTTRASEGGTGLGLSLAKRIVESAGGSITVRSRPGDTRFEVRLPVAVPQEV